MVATIGEQTAAALIKAAASMPNLEWALVPRCILGYLDVMSHADQYSDHLPGCPDIHLDLQKSAKGYTGCVEGPEGPYCFADQTLEHVAGSVAVAMHLEVSNPSFQHPSLPRLGKSVALLVKSRTVRALAAMAARRPPKPAEAKAPPGPAAVPKAPLGAVAPTMQPPNKGATPGAADAPATKPGRAKVKPLTMQVTKMQALTRCGVCDECQFEGAEFKGCLCFQELAKSVKVLLRADGQSYTLEFSGDWDRDAVLSLAEAVGR